MVVGDAFARFWLGGRILQRRRNLYDLYTNVSRGNGRCACYRGYDRLVRKRLVYEKHILPATRQTQDFTQRSDNPQRGFTYRIARSRNNAAIQNKPRNQHHPN